MFVSLDHLAGAFASQWETVFRGDAARELKPILEDLVCQEAVTTNDHWGPDTAYGISDEGIRLLTVLKGQTLPTELNKQFLKEVRRSIFPPFKTSF